MSWLDPLKHEIQDDGTPLPDRAALNIIGGTLEDDPANNATTLTITGGGGGVGGAVTHIVAAASPYTILTTDVQIGVDATAGNVTVRMPTSPASGKGYVVFDETGSVPGHSITITSTDGSTVNGLSSWTIPAAYGSVELLFTGSGRWHVR